eukprot:5667005-Amphidinium_carterae.1
MLGLYWRLWPASCSAIPGRRHSNAKPMQSDLFVHGEPRNNHLLPTLRSTELLILHKKVNSATCHPEKPPQSITIHAAMIT